MHTAVVDTQEVVADIAAAVVAAARSMMMMAIVRKKKKKKKMMMMMKQKKKEEAEVQWPSCFLAAVVVKIEQCGMEEEAEAVRHFGRQLL